MQKWILACLALVVCMAGPGIGRASPLDGPLPPEVQAWVAKSGCVGESDAGEPPCSVSSFAWGSFSGVGRRELLLSVLKEPGNTHIYYYLLDPATGVAQEYYSMECTVGSVRFLGAIRGPGGTDRVLAVVSCCGESGCGSDSLVALQVVAGSTLDVRSDDLMPLRSGDDSDIGEPATKYWVTDITKVDIADAGKGDGVQKVTLQLDEQEGKVRKEKRGKPRKTVRSVQFMFEGEKLAEVKLPVPEKGKKPGPRGKKKCDSKTK